MKSPSVTTALDEDENFPLVLRSYETNDIDVAIRKAAKEFPGKTLYLLDETALASSARRIVEAFCPNLDFAQVAYAMKANGDPNVLSLLHQAGIDRVECASSEEVVRAKKVNPDVQILSNNPAKPWTEYVEEIALGVRHWTVDTHDAIIDILDAVEQTGELIEIEVAVRMETPNDQATVDLSSKFGGIEEDTLMMLEELAKYPFIRRGIAIHTGSQNPNPEIFVQWIKKLIELVRTAGKVHFLNFGGGVPANYNGSRDYDPIVFMRAMTEAIEDNIEGALLDDPAIYIELGRVLVAEAITQIIPVLRRRVKKGNNYLHIGESRYGGLSANAQFGWYFGLDPFAAEGKELSKKEADFRIWGRSCDTSDGLKNKEGEFHIYSLPQNIDKGDLLINRTAGAYERACASNFHLYRKPPYIHYNCIK